jgi:hypothetical protein
MKTLIFSTVCGIFAGALTMRLWINSAEPWTADPVTRWQLVATGPGSVPILTDGTGRLFRVYVRTDGNGAEWGLVEIFAR